MRLLLTAIVLIGCGSLKPLTRADRLTAEEKLNYLILKALNPVSAKEYLTLGTPEARDDYLRWFWQNQQAGDYQTFYQRAKRARELFGTLDLLGDERVTTYIRYGPPRREEFAPKPVETETSRIFVNPAEIWTYDSLGLQFDFVKKGVGFKKIGTSRFGKSWLPAALEEVDYNKPPPKPAPDSRLLNFFIALYRLGQSNDTVEVELHYGIAPTNQDESQNALKLLYLRFEFTSQHYGVFKTEGWFGCTPDTASTYIVGRQVFFLPVDVYSVTAFAITRDGAAWAERQAKLNLIDYIRRSQPCSDIIFYALVDSHFQSQQFQRPDWRRVIPLIMPEVTSGSTFYILYEIYNLTIDHLGQHRAEADYEIMDLATRQLAVIPTPSRFITGEGSKGVAVERIHTMDLKPGRYMLVARIKDLNSQQAVSLTTDFKILPR
ncbi:MAG: hypothetical protein ABIK39_05415 [candidate division WOR-3 bacterium]